jgi:hypothetical protein
METISVHAQDLDHDAEEKLLVHAWRAKQLRGHGMPFLLAETFADLVDWHAFADLVRRGCPPKLAFEIVR